MESLKGVLREPGWFLSFPEAYGPPSCSCKGSLGFIKGQDLQTQYRVFCHSVLSSLSTKAKGVMLDAIFVRGGGDVAQLHNCPGSLPRMYVLPATPPHQASDASWCWIRRWDLRRLYSSHLTSREHDHEHTSLKSPRKNSLRRNSVSGKPGRPHRACVCGEEERASVYDLEKRPTCSSLSPLAAEKGGAK